MFFNQTFGMWNKTLKIEVICTHRHRASRIKERTLAFPRWTSASGDWSRFSICNSQFPAIGLHFRQKTSLIWQPEHTVWSLHSSLRSNRIHPNQSTVYKHSRKSRLFASSWFTLTSRRKVKLNVGDDRILRMDSVGLGSFKIEIRNSWNWICGRYFKRNLL